MRDIAPDDAEVVFMYLPFTGSVLANVMAQLTERRNRLLRAGAVDTRRYQALVAAGPPRSWLHFYAWR